MSAERFRQTVKNHFRDKSLRELQEELRSLKEKEKYYLKLSHKVKELEDKSKKIKRASEDIVNQNFDNEQIGKLKQDIEKTLAETKRIDEDNRVIKEQTKSLEGQLKALEGVYNNICNDNKSRRQRIQLRDEQLVEKENEVQSLVERKNCNELVIEELRIEISRLQDEESELRTELEDLRLQRQEEEREKERLRSMVTECKKQILEQEKYSQEHRLGISQMKEANYIVKEELITLIKLEEKLKGELETLINTYNNTVSLEISSQNKIKSLEDELNNVEQDLKLLTDEYLKQNQTLKEQQALNEKLNHEIDQLAKEVFSVWQSVRDMIEIQGDSNSDLKTKAYKAWIEISQILSLN